MQEWEIALNTFLDEWRDKDCVIGALVCGSFITGNPTKHSDIDVHIILADGTDWRERGNRIVDGFLIEYFANPPGQIMEYFKEDYNDNRRSAAVQFATGRILFDKDGIIEQLKIEAAEWAAKPLAKSNPISIELSKYTLWDNLDNLQDAYERRSPDFAFIYHHSLSGLYAIYAKFLVQPVLAFSQQYGCLSQPDRAKTKYLMEPFPDEEFRSLFLSAIEETDQDKMLQHAEALTRYVQDKIGGFEIDGWKFRSPAEV